MRLRQVLGHLKATRRMVLRDIAAVPGEARAPLQHPSPPERLGQIEHDRTRAPPAGVYWSFTCVQFELTCGYAAATMKGMLSNQHRGTISVRTGDGIASDHAMLGSACGATEKENRGNEL
jgi:hypothetical protein